MMNATIQKTIFEYNALQRSIVSISIKTTLLSNKYKIIVIMAEMQNQRLIDELLAGSVEQLSEQDRAELFESGEAISKSNKALGRRES